MVAGPGGATPGAPHQLKGATLADSEPLLLRIAQRHPKDSAVAKRIGSGLFPQQPACRRRKPIFERWCEANPSEPGALHPAYWDVGEVEPAAECD